MHANLHMNFSRTYLHKRARKREQQQHAQTGVNALTRKRLRAQIEDQYKVLSKIDFLFLGFRLQHVTQYFSAQSRLPLKKNPSNRIGQVRRMKRASTRDEGSVVLLWMAV